RTPRGDRPSRLRGPGLRTGYIRRQTRPDQAIPARREIDVSPSARGGNSRLRVQTTRRPASLARSSSAGASLRRARRGLNIGSEEAVLPRPPLLFWQRFLEAFRGANRYVDGPDSLPIPPVARPESLIEHERGG